MCLKSWLVLYFSFLASFTHSYSGQDSCRLSRSWSGEWFESGVPGTISITSNSSRSSIQHKGQCVKKIKHSNSQFIFQSQSEGNCYRCLSIHQKHGNVLQYKESRCMLDYHPRNYHELCWSISVDEPLKTMFRVNGNGVPCPITGTFSFSYSRGHGLCNYPLSSLHQCADKSQLVLSYQACVDIKGSQSHTEQAQCIGDWKEGSTYYFAAVMNSSHVSRFNREDSFRCFVYKQIHNGYQLSQSAEAKCNLYTAAEGYRTMTLTKLREDDSTCQFPSWFTGHRRYHSLAGRDSYSVNQEGSVITIQPEEAATDIEAVDESLRRTRLECISEKFVANNTARFTVQSVQSCQQATFHCVHIWQRTPSVVEIKIGKPAPSNEDACLEQLFFDDSIPIQTITAAHLHSSTCPLTGNFVLAGLGSEGGCSADSKLTAGCDTNTNKINLKNSCNKKNTEFSCHDSWEQEDLFSKKKYTIVSYKSSHSTSAKGCLVKATDSKSDDTVLSLKEGCSATSREIWSAKASNFGDCAPTALATANTGERLLAGSTFLIFQFLFSVLKLYQNSISIF